MKEKKRKKKKAKAPQKKARLLAFWFVLLLKGTDDYCEDESFWSARFFIVGIEMEAMDKTERRRIARKKKKEKVRGGAARRRKKEMKKIRKMGV